ncbi:hypothetical protein IBA8401_47800 [Pseudomonas syringae]|uniref:hypothetical protein n=1 Tax=Pseudomonas syringae TaxID=317 RepID=UPI0032E72045
MMNDNEWVQAASIYKAMAGSKSGFSDVYVERGDAEKEQSLILGFMRLEKFCGACLEKSGSSQLLVSAQGNRRHRQLRVT